MNQKEESIAIQKLFDMARKKENKYWEKSILPTYLWP